MRFQGWMTGDPSATWFQFGKNGGATSLRPRAFAMYIDSLKGISFYEINEKVSIIMKNWSVFWIWKKSSNNLNPWIWLLGPQTSRGTRIFSLVKFFSLKVAQSEQISQVFEFSSMYFLACFTWLNLFSILAWYKIVQIISSTKILWIFLCEVILFIFYA